ncbi:MAG: helix-turn-helix domain-containing protein, partial [Actinomycetota bacterium]
MQRRFVAETGLTFTLWRAQLRLQAAAALLSAGESVETVAMRCGYASTGGFARAFKAATGLTPSSFTAPPGPTLRFVRADWRIVRDDTQQAQEVIFSKDGKAPYTTVAAPVSTGALLLASCSDDQATNSTVLESDAASTLPDDTTTVESSEPSPSAPAMTADSSETSPPSTPTTIDVQDT